MDCNVTGIILSGGPGTRCGGLDKGLMLLDGKPMIEYVIAQLRPQVGEIVISASRNQERYTQYGYPVVPDQHTKFGGPLGGIASALGAISTDFATIVPCDAPMLAPDLVDRLIEVAGRQAVPLAVAHDGKHIQPLFLLLARSFGPDLVTAAARGDGDLEDWLATQRYATCHMDSAEMFMEVNDMDQRSTIERHLREQRLGHAPQRKKRSPLTRAYRKWRARRDSNSRPPGS